MTINCNGHQPFHNQWLVKQAGENNMNLRFATHSMRLRLTPEEFTQLHSGKNLALEVALPRGHAFRLKVNQSSVVDWRFDSDPTGLWLTVPRSELDALAQSLPSKHGITHAFTTTQGELQIVLEVDAGHC
jgi:hypothetical protein